MLVGGQGTRLRPLTVTTPKPMLPVAGVPFIAHQLARLRAAGVDHAVLATSYRPEVFSAYLGDGSGVGVEVDYVTETEPLGTGGGIRNVVDRLRGAPDAPVVVLNGDVLSDHDIAAQLRAHQHVDAAVTLHLTVVDDARAFGCVPTEPDGRVTAFLEKAAEPVTNQINAGCYVFRRSVIDTIPAGRPVSVERETFPALLEAGERLQAHVEQSYWLDIGTPSAYLRACTDIVAGVVTSPAVSVGSGDCLLLGDAHVDDGARVVNGSTVGPGARVGTHTVVDGSVILDGATIGRRTRITASIIGRGVCIGDGCVVDGAILADGAKVGDANELCHGIRVWPGVELPARSVRFSTDASG